jgi:hypothetical protein
MVAERRANLIRWFPSLLAADVLFLVLCRNVLLPGNPVELRFMALAGLAAGNRRRAPDGTTGQWRG